MTEEPHIGGLTPPGERDPEVTPGRPGAEPSRWPVSSTVIERGIVMISVSLPYELDCINLYWLDGEPPTLIDTGPYIPGAYNSIVDELKHMRLPFPGRVIITHGHIDHYGLAREFSRKMGCEIWVHREDRDRVARHEEMLKATADYYRGIAREWGAQPVFQDVVGHVMEQFSLAAHSAHVDLELEGGEEFGDNHNQARVYHCPGHSAGEIILHLPMRGIIITGDHLLESITPNPELYFPPRGGMISGLQDYISSLAIVAALKARLALPGHGRPFADPGGRAKVIVKHHWERLRLIRDMIRAGHTGLLDLCYEVFRDELAGGDPLQLFLAAKEILGHLEILARDGKVRIVEGEGAGFAEVLPL